MALTFSYVFSTFIRRFVFSHYMVGGGGCLVTLSLMNLKYLEGTIKGVWEVWHQGKIWLRHYNVRFVIQWDNVILNIISNPCGLAPVASFGLHTYLALTCWTQTLPFIFHYYEHLLIMVRVLPAIEQRGTGCPCPGGYHINKEGKTIQI